MKGNNKTDVARDKHLLRLSFFEDISKNIHKHTNEKTFV